jgi:AcrR family transcriptional regulator
VAGLTERYFYESFDDREALLVAVFDSVAERAATVVLEATAAAPHDARLRSRAAIGAFVGLVTGDPRLGRILLLEALGAEPLERRRREALRVFAQLIAAQAAAFYGDAAPEPVDAELTALALVGALAELLIVWLGGGLDVPLERLVDHCASLFVAAAEVSIAPD